MKKYIPNIELSFKPDSRQNIADSWVDSIDDSEARADWGWSHEVGLEDLVKIMYENLSKKLKQWYCICIRKIYWYVDQRITCNLFSTNNLTKPTYNLNSSLSSINNYLFITTKNKSNKTPFYIDNQNMSESTSMDI